jgi:uncharacterized damage-inducible protein DinB
MQKSRIPLWFERKFEFTFPVEQFPNLCVRLRGTPARVEDMLSEVGRDVLVRNQTDGWSAQEHVGHLLDMEPLWMRRAHDFLSDGDTLTPADLTNRRTHEAQHNNRDIREIMAEFRTTRLALADYLGSLDPNLFSRARAHPRLKQPMRLIDHLFFVAEHDDHHLARIWEMIQEAAHTT